MTPRVTPRFRGPAASLASQQLAAALIVGSILALGTAGVLRPLPVLVFFAVGAGAGYSLSGSV